MCGESRFDRPLANGRTDYMIRKAVTEMTLHGTKAHKAATRRAVKTKVRVAVAPKKTGKPKK